MSIEYWFMGLCIYFASKLGFQINYLCIIPSYQSQTKDLTNEYVPTINLTYNLSFYFVFGFNGLCS